MNGMLPSKTPMDPPYAEPIRKALFAARGVEPLLYPTLGASLPDYVFTKILGVPAFIVPYANADEADHRHPTKISRSSASSTASSRGRQCLAELGKLSRR